MAKYLMLSSKLITGLLRYTFFINQAMEAVTSFTDKINISRSTLQKNMSHQNDITPSELNICKESQCDKHQMCKIVEGHKNGKKVLVIMRGLPGSGKTFLSEQIINNCGENIVRDHNISHICSTDDYFIQSGMYKFDKCLIAEAHTWNQNRAKDAMIQGLSPIIIDNTNIKLWEMEQYVKHGVIHGYHIEVIEIDTPWAKNVKKLSKRNTHKVPAVKIQNMLKNYQTGITGDYLIKYFGLSNLLTSTERQETPNENSGGNNFLMAIERAGSVLEEERKAFAKVEEPIEEMKQMNMTTVKDFRETAEKYLQARNQCIEKAQEYARRGMTTMASHFSELANSHERNYEEASSSAAVSLIQMQNSKNPKILDLHFLRVVEAKVALDLYLDEHICKTRENPNRKESQILSIITGRGLHSEGGPKIKPAVKKRLQQRNIKYAEKNPGCLSVMVTANTKLLYELLKNK